MSPHILIIGGGIGGLALAQGLKKNGIPYTLFERDLSDMARAQGYRIRIAGVGADALEECLDDETWNLFERTCAEMKQGSGARFNALDGTKLEGLFGPGTQRARNIGTGRPGRPGDVDHRAYTVDRTLLRNVLLLGQEENVKFGKAFVRYAITSTGVTAFFADGTNADGSLLVGAEGVNSLVRKQLLPRLKYLDTRCRVIYGKTLLTEELVRRFPSDALQGMTVIQDEKPMTLFLEAIRFPNDAHAESGGRLPTTEDYVYWVLGSHSDHFEISDDEFFAMSNRETVQLTLQLTKSWDPAIRSLFDLQTTSQSSPLRITTAKPGRPEWDPSACVTLLGDAIHAMAPAGGSGANAALADSALLARLLSGEGISEATLEEFKKQMWSYVQPLIEGSALGAKVLLGFRGFEDAKEVP